MLAYLITVIPQTPLLTLITYRPEYRGALAQVPGAQTIALAPLRAAETAALVGQLLGPDPSVAGLGRTITERAAGTPFFAEEIVREFAERGVLQGKLGTYVSTTEPADVSVPATLHATIAARIDRLDPKAKRTLSAASVVGSRFGLDLLTRLGIEPEVAGLVAGQLVDQVTFTAEPDFVFHHPLIRAVAYEAQLKSDRADLHRRVAAAIEQRSAASLDANAALIAEHLEAAGDLHAAFDWHMRAGTWLNNLDVAAARVSWERARQVADSLPDDDPNRAAMRIAPRAILCATVWRARALDDSEDRFEELRDLCAQSGDKTSLALAILGPMSTHMQRGEIQQASRLASEQMALLESFEDPSLTVVAAFGVMGVKASVGEMSDVLRWAQTTVEWADGDPTKGALMVGSPLAMALALRGVGRWWFGRPGWRADLDEAYLIAETSEPLTLAVVVSWKFGLGIAQGILAPDDATVHTIEKALTIAEASGNDYAVEMVKTIFATALFHRGSAAERRRGLEILTPLMEAWVRQRYMLSELPFANIYVGREAVRRGDRDGGLALMREAVEDVFARGQIPYCPPLTNFLVETLLTSGTDRDLAEAEAAIARVAAVPAEGSVIRDVWLLRMRALLARAKGDDSYANYRDRYREMAKSLGFVGHIDWAEAMP